MTTSAVRQRQDFPVGTQFAPTFLSGPQINLIPKTSADIAARAAAKLRYWPAEGPSFRTSSTW